jgi:hypothetical protein
MIISLYVITCMSERTVHVFWGTSVNCEEERYVYIGIICIAGCHFGHVALYLAVDLDIL